MGIVAILFGIGVPSYRYVTTANRMSSEINGLLGDLQFARSEAIREGQTVNVCVSSDGLTCAVGVTSWNSGWIVYSDLNGNGAPDSGEIFRKQAAFTAQDTLSGSINTLSFNREGFLIGIASADKLTLHDSTQNQAYSRCLSYTRTGLMATSTHTSDSTCT